MQEHSVLCQEVIKLLQDALHRKPASTSSSSLAVSFKKLHIKHPRHDRFPPSNDNNDNDKDPEKNI